MTLDKDMITEPRMWQLVMEPGSAALSVMAFSPIEHHSIIAADIPYPPDAEPASAFRDAVYDNPLLLNDFLQTTVLLPTRRCSRQGALPAPFPGRRRRTSLRTPYRRSPFPAGEAGFRD